MIYKHNHGTMHTVFAIISTPALINTIQYNTVLITPSTSVHVILHTVFAIISIPALNHIQTYKHNHDGMYSKT